MDICITFIKTPTLLKHFLIYILLFNFGLTSYAQNIQLELTGSSISETKVIDSLNYLSKHTNAKSIRDEIELTIEKLSQIGFIETKILAENKINDSTYSANLNLGERITHIHIYIGTNLILRTLLSTNNLKDTIILPYRQTEAFLNQGLQDLDKMGYAFAKLKLTKIQKKETTLFATLYLEQENLRKLNSIVIKYETLEQNGDFPKGYLAQINRKYKDKIFNKQLIGQIHDDFENYNFVDQIRYPEILFTKDTTKVYVYVEKRKSNTFDGFIGFNNNESKKLSFNGYLDLTLQNILKAGEQFSLYWKSDGNQQKTFSTALELPYIFKSPLGLKGQLNIFKQDSTFQNTKTAINISYYLNYNTRLYLGYQSTVSSDIQNIKSASITDYNSNYLTSEFEYFKLDTNNSLFWNKSQLNIKTGIGKRKTNDVTDNSVKNRQFYIDLFAIYTFYLNNKNYINIRSQNHYLQSTNYITNELFRFGGINSIRGFSENSLQANFMTAILTEYRYFASQTLYFHTIIDYCYFKDPSKLETTETNSNLFGAGFGLGLLTNSGLLKLAFANGLNNTDNVTFANSIIHISYSVKF